MGLEIHDGLSSYFGKLLDVFYDKDYFSSKGYEIVHVHPDTFIAQKQF